MSLIQRIVERKEGVSNFTSVPSWDSGSNSIEKQMSSVGISGNIESPKKRKEGSTKSEMSNDLNEVEKDELVRYRRDLVRKIKERKKKEDKGLRERLNKYKNPLPVRIQQDIKREKNIQSDSDISPIV